MDRATAEQICLLLVFLQERLLVSDALQAMPFSKGKTNFLRNVTLHYRIEIQHIRARSKRRVRAHTREDRLKKERINIMLYVRCLPSTVRNSIDARGRILGILNGIN